MSCITFPKHQHAKSDSPIPWFIMTAAGMGQPFFPLPSLPSSCLQAGSSDSACVAQTCVSYNTSFPPFPNPLPPSLLHLLPFFLLFLVASSLSPERMPVLPPYAARATDVLRDHRMQCSSLRVCLVVLLATAGSSFTVTAPRVFLADLDGSCRSLSPYTLCVTLPPGLPSRVCWTLLAFTGSLHSLRLRQRLFVPCSSCVLNARRCAGHRPPQQRG